MAKSQLKLISLLTVWGLSVVVMGGEYMQNSNYPDQQDSHNNNYNQNHQYPNNDSNYNQQYPNSNNRNQQYPNNDGNDRNQQYPNGNRNQQYPNYDSQNRNNQQFPYNDTQNRNNQQYPYNNNQDQRYPNNNNNQNQRYPNDNNQNQRYPNDNNQNQRYPNDNNQNERYPYDNNRNDRYPNDNNRSQQYPNNNNRNQQYPNNNQNQPYDTTIRSYDISNDQHAKYGTDDNKFDYNGQQYGDNGQQSDDNCCEDYCYSTDEDPYINFATKTAYDSVNSRRSQQQQQHDVPDCTPVQFWSLNRHGTRLPSARKIENLRKLSRLHQEIVRNYMEKHSFPKRGKLCQDDFNLLKRWRWNDTITEQRANSLTSQGIEELRLLARRYRAKFSQLLQDPYSERTYQFQYTNTDRTHDSYQAYIEGLFASEAYRVHANMLPNDNLIRPTESCETWQRNVGDNPETYREFRRFTQNAEYLQMNRDVLRRLGFQFTLNSSVVSDMYDLCRYEKAWFVEKRSPWCAAFTKKHLKLLEYAEDLKYYYKSGYGNELNKQLGCATLKDMYEKFERTVNGNNDGNKGTFYFTHSATIQATLAAMNFAKDVTPLTADNYYQQSRRQWRTTTIDPFGANLVAVLYECRSGDRHRVMFFLNEVPVQQPACSVGLCSWSVVTDKYKSLVDSCNVDGFCSGRAGASTVHLNYVVYLISLILSTSAMVVLAHH